MDLKCNTFVDLSRLNMRRFWFTYIYFSHPKALENIYTRDSASANAIAIAIVQCSSLEWMHLCSGRHRIYVPSAMNHHRWIWCSMIFEVSEWRKRARETSICTTWNDVYNCFTSNRFPLFLLLFLDFKHKIESKTI